MAYPKAIRDNLATVIAGVLVAIVLALAWLLLLPRASTDAPLVARVHDADGVAHELPLDQDGQLVVQTSLGRNVLVVEKGACRMLEADCPNGNCLRQHAIDAPGQQLICLPHRLWVEVVEQGAPDGQMDASLVASDEADDAGVDLVSR